MFSMTGYGKGAAAENGITFTIELKSVNNRYLEINTRLPKVMSAYEDILRQEIQNSVRRGTVDVFFSFENNSVNSKPVTFDENLVAAYCAAAKAMSEKFPVSNDLSVSDLFRLPDVVKAESAKDDPELMKRLMRASVSDALARLNTMRKTEGDGIKASLETLISNLSGLLKSAAERAPSVVTEFRVRLEARMKELLQSVAVDEARLLNETAFFADKADINEEISRLSSHISQFIKTLESDEQQGRKLDFIAQEMNREINTMGSKSNDLELTELVIAMKNELEKVKEQIRNVE